MSEVLQKSPAVRLLGELCVISVGVLLALGAESWWQGRGDAERVTSYLLAIQADLQQAEESVAAALVGTLEQQERSSEILGWLYSETTLPDSLTIGGGGAGGVATVPIGNLKTFIDTGDVNLIGDLGARSAIVADFAVLERFLRFMEQLLDRGFVANAELLRAQAELGSPDVLVRGGIPAELGRRSPAVRGHYLVNANWLGNRVTALRILERTIARLQEAVDTALASQ